MGDGQRARVRKTDGTVGFVAESAQPDFGLSPDIVSSGSTTVVGFVTQTGVLKVGAFPSSGANPVFAPLVTSPVGAASLLPPPLASGTTPLDVYVESNRLNLWARLADGGSRFVATNPSAPFPTAPPVVAMVLDRPALMVAPPSSTFTTVYALDSFASNSVSGKGLALASFLVEVKLS